MLAKIFLVVSLATLAMSFPKDDNVEEDLINTALSAGSGITKVVSKVMVNDAEKFAMDLNSLYKKYEISNKAEQAKNFLQSQYKKGTELTNLYFKKFDLESEEHLKKYIEMIKVHDSALADKLTKFYEKTCELDRISEDIVKYVLDVDKVNGAFEKFKDALHPLEHKLIDSVKKFEAILHEQLSKKGK